MLENSVVSVNSTAKECTDWGLGSEDRVTDGVGFAIVSKD